MVSCATSTSFAEPGVEVVVSGSTVDRHASADAAASSSVLRRSDLESPGATSATVLARVPGVQVQQTASGSDLATASLRGTSSAQTPVYLAGIRLNDDLSGTADLSTIPLWMLDRIEVYRGNAPANVELLGIGGAVMFEPRYPKGNETHLGATWGSFGQQSMQAAAGQGSRRAQSLVAVRRESARNDYFYLDNGGTAFTANDDRWTRRVNADQTTTDGWAIGRYQAGNSGRVLMLANAFDREQGVPGLLAIPARRARAHIRRELMGVSAESAISCSVGLPCRLKSASSFQWASTALSDPSFELGLGAPELASESRRVSHSTQLDWPLHERFNLVPISTLSAETLKTSRAELAALGAERLHTGVGASARWQSTDALTILATTRLDIESTKTSNDAIIRSLPTGRLGAAFRALPGLTILANAGHYNRMPTLGELYGSSAFVAGNPGLKPERGLNRDVGARYSSHMGSAKFSVEAFAFQQNLDDLVAWQRSSFGQIRPYNVGQARLRGIESNWGLDLLSIFRVESSATLLDPRDISDQRLVKNDILPFRSRLVVDARVEVHTSHPSRLLRLRRASFSLRGSHRSSRYQDKAGLIIIPHSSTFDLEGALDFSDAPISLHAAIYNVTDQPRFDMVGYPLPPRMVAIGATFDWERKP